MPEESIPFLSLVSQHQPIGREVEEALMRVYTSHWYVLGHEVDAFEKEYAAHNGVNFCVGVGNGLDALTISLLACGVGAGDEVIVPAHTYLATWLAVSKTGATLIPVEPDEFTCNVAPAGIEPRITARTKAILPVHLYGQACDMTAIASLADKYNLAIIEDNAQAHGSMWLKTKTGSWGKANATSFYPTKNLGAMGDGGAITTDNEAVARFAKQYRNYGFEVKNMAIHQGVNSRLDELQAAVLRIKLRQLDLWNDQRRQLAVLYLEQLKDTGDIILPLSDKEAYHVYHLFVIRTQHRDALKAHLAKKGIETMIHYPVPPHLQKCYEHLSFRKGEFPLTEKIAETALSLPLWPGMTPSQVARVCDAVRSFF
ncbi:MAG TPA: DegT/DnrJ/EryC1/StrS family aminotransferase [Ohtaekwangia sp.]|uniref:DegT/DnrJ/EryC1/StrS family aminotransferase n=1 Tax=Ohtaekwangia sp. TaxID=2066019 RepID=UPI002F947E12